MNAHNVSTTIVTVHSSILPIEFLLYTVEVRPELMLKAAFSLLLLEIRMYTSCCVFGHPYMAFELE